MIGRNTIRRAGYVSRRKPAPSMEGGSGKSWRGRSRVEANNAQGCRRAKRGNTQETHFYRSDPASRREERTGAIRAGSMEKRNVLCWALVALATLNEEDLGSGTVRPKQGVRLKGRAGRQCGAWRLRMRGLLDATELPATADVRSRLIWQGER